MAFGSMAWLISVIGIAFPSVATLLLAFVTIPRWVRPAWIRLAMFAIAVVSPLLVGGTSLLALDPVGRPRGAAQRVKVIVRGYPVTIGLAERLTTLQSAQLEVTLHPSDLILAGPSRDVMNARARLAERLAFSKLYMTWTADAQRLEDKLRKIWLGIEVSNGHGRAESPPALDHDLKTAELPFEEWEVLFRKELLLERRLHGLAVDARELPSPH